MSPGKGSGRQSRHHQPERRWLACFARQEDSVKPLFRADASTALASSRDGWVEITVPLGFLPWRAAGGKEPERRDGSFPAGYRAPSERERARGRSRGGRASLRLGPSLPTTGTPHPVRPGGSRLRGTVLSQPRTDPRLPCRGPRSGCVGSPEEAAADEATQQGSCVRPSARKSPASSVV